MQVAGDGEDVAPITKYVLFSLVVWPQLRVTVSKHLRNIAACFGWSVGGGDGFTPHCVKRPTEYSCIVSVTR